MCNRMNMSIKRYIQNLVLLKSGSFSNQMNFILLEFTFFNSLKILDFEAQMTGKFIILKTCLVNSDFLFILRCTN